MDVACPDYRAHSQVICDHLTGMYAEHAVGWQVIHMDPFVVIEGGAKGADAIAAWWADVSPLHGPSASHPEYKDHSPPCEHEQYKADWAKYGKSAGPVRNQVMLDSGVDIVLAYHNDIQTSRGTADMVRRARQHSIPVYLTSLVP